MIPLLNSIQKRFGRRANLQHTQPEQPPITIPEVISLRGHHLALLCQYSHDTNNTPGAQQRYLEGWVHSYGEAPARFTQALFDYLLQNQDTQISIVDGLDNICTGGGGCTQMADGIETERIPLFVGDGTSCMDNSTQDTFVLVRYTSSAGLQDVIFKVGSPIQVRELLAANARYQERYHCVTPNDEYGDKVDKILNDYFR